jgi:hypothetical protein
MGIGSKPQLVDEHPEDLSYSFDSAWVPPKPLIKAMGQMFPELTFTLSYEEPGLNIKGQFIMSNTGCTRRKNNCLRN